MSSDRVFGTLWAAVFAVIGIVPLAHGRTPRVWALWLSVVLLAAAVFRPGVLHRLNAAWMQLGRLLNRVTSPVITAVVFYFVFTPAGVLTRFFRQDPLRLRPDPTAESYWIPRHDPQDRWGAF